MVELLVIGGGPAGIVAAKEAASLGAEVTLLTSEPLGGRANWSSLLPSKVYLTAADHVGEALHNTELGLLGSPPVPDLPAIRQRIVDLAQSSSDLEQKKLQELGVHIKAGKARFIHPSKVEIANNGSKLEHITFDKAVVATGSIPTFPPGIRPDGQRILAPRFAGKLSEWPAHVIVIGGGVTGAEFTYLFNCMGSTVTWVTDLTRMLPRADIDVAKTLEDAFAARGINLLTSQPVTSVSVKDVGVAVSLENGLMLDGSHAFLALGRRPDLADLGLEAAGIKTTDHGIVVDPYGRTSQPHIYAAGDVTGPPYVANRGQTQARVAARHAMAVETLPFMAQTVVEAVYTDPQVSQVGMTETEAVSLKRAVRVHRACYGEALKPRLTKQSEGFAKIIVDADDHKIVGAAAVGVGAAEIMMPTAVAICAGMTIEAVAAMFPAYPTHSELIGIAARAS